MRDRRFVPSKSVIRLGDSVRSELRRVIDQSPSAIRKVRAKNAELNAKVEAGEITHERARVAYLRFISLIVAHVREHEQEGVVLSLNDRPNF
jgi:hypothetical protein